MSTPAAPPPIRPPRSPAALAPWRRPCRALVLLLLAAPAGAAPEPSPGDAPRWAALGTLEVPVREVSGLAPLPGGDADHVPLLAVTDEGPYDAAGGFVDGALFRLDLDLSSGAPVAERVRPVRLHLRLERFDPGWPTAVSPLDLESLVPLPGTPDLFLLAGERNPEDQTDDGANRLYVARYPAPSDERAEVVAYLRVLDVQEDQMNDRFEGIAAAAVPGVPGTWRVWLFKERTSWPGRVPGYVTGLLVRQDGAFSLSIAGDRGYPPLAPSFYTRDPERLGNQSDACLAPDGRVLVLDRWRRMVHALAPDDRGLLRLEESTDLWPFVRAIPGESVAGEPAPPGLPDRAGYGRHEALAVDAAGRWIAGSDRGGGSPSTITVLVPRPAPVPSGPGR